VERSFINRRSSYVVQERISKSKGQVSVGTGMQDMKLQPEGIGRRLQFLRCLAFVSQTKGKDWQREKPGHWV
jgi:hypothetical protein